MACSGVEDHDPAHALVDPLAIEGEPLPIGRPHRIFVAPAFGGVGDLADMASVWIHREDSALGLIGIEVATKGDLTVRNITVAGCALLVLLASSASSAGAQCHSKESRQHPRNPQCP